MKLTSAHPTDRRGPGFLVMEIIKSRLGPLRLRHCHSKYVGNELV